MPPARRRVAWALAVIVVVGIGALSLRRIDLTRVALEMTRAAIEQDVDARHGEGERASTEA